MKQPPIEDDFRSLKDHKVDINDEIEEKTEAMENGSSGEGIEVVPTDNQEIELKEVH